ncbi:glyoxalase [Subtercola boreus]|uniref:Glyoxalase n=1 Tax=Subtercola boreus TaxID=120213 RepID=A0A3E0VF72_9MICO|nr:VOC family protein [Subtercola boreus]RFA07507.1 glyoxalase [Subtercola boreus]
MSSFISHTTVDCTDAYALSTWWKATLGYTDLADDPNGPGDEECMIRDPESGQMLLFVETPDAVETKQRAGKNRIHFDLRPRHLPQQEEVDALVSRGASVVADLRGKYGPGTGWVVLADPEDNEFCVLRSEAERAEAGA